MKNKTFTMLLVGAVEDRIDEIAFIVPIPTDELEDVQMELRSLIDDINADDDVYELIGEFLNSHMLTSTVHYDYDGWESFVI